MNLHVNHLIKLLTPFSQMVNLFDQKELSIETATTQRFAIARHLITMNQTYVVRLLYNTYSLILQLRLHR